MKRYRKPKVGDEEIKMQMGKDYGEVDICVFFGKGVPKCDTKLVLNYICSEIPNFVINGTSEMRPSLIEELDRRGYDLDTLRISIKKKAEK
jgi:hypothetical protein